VLLDEFAAGFDLVAHQDGEQVGGGAGVIHADLHQRAGRGVERRVAELLRVHLSDAC
jgi:hypothetical protein